MDITDNITVRPFNRLDVADLLDLMKQLAKFEGYFDDFAVSEADLLIQGLGEDKKFQAFVAPNPNGSDLLGMAVTYIIPWTYDQKPVLVLKELFVVESARGLGVGRRLMSAVITQAVEIGASQIKWTVLVENERAKSFYSGFSAAKDEIWETWQLPRGSYDAALAR